MKQHATCRKAFRSLFLLLGGIGLILFTSLSAGAELSPLTDEELAAVSAQGFSDFSYENGVARIALGGLQVSTYTTIDSLKMGYWDNGTTTGWDQNWQNVSLGSSLLGIVSPLDLKGLIFEAEFENIESATNRRLVSFRFGFEDVSGTVKADFQSLSGTSGDGNLVRSDRGTKTYNFDHDPFIIEFNADQGVRTNFGGAS